MDESVEDREPQKYWIALRVDCDGVGFFTYSDSTTPVWGWRSVMLFLASNSKLARAAIVCEGAAQTALQQFDAADLVLSLY